MAPPFSSSDYDTIFSLTINSSNIINGLKLYWSEIRLNLEVLQKFDIRKFPFDKQNISLGLEFTYNDPKILKINLSKKDMEVIRKYQKMILNNVAQNMGYDNWSELKNDALKIE